jgi:hypothetical protein
LKGQCKAHREKIDAGPLRQFFGDVEKARGRSDRVTGVFVSLSGFSGTAARWYDELSEKQRTYFKTFDSVEFLTQLQEATLVCSQSQLMTRLSALTKLDVTGLALLLSERGPFWFIKFGDETTATAYHAFLVGSGGIPRREDVEYLEARISTIEKTRRISFAGRGSVIRVLLRDRECPTKDISSRTGESREDIEAVTASLSVEGFLRVTKGNAVLRQEVDSVLAIAELSLGGDMELDFMKSAFYRDTLQPIVLPFIEAKYVMKFDPDEANVVLRILSVSPLALRRVLTGDAELFRNTEEEILRLKFTGHEAARHRRASRVMFVDRLVHDLMSDHIESKVTPLFAHHGIIMTKTSLELKLGKRNESFLIISSSWFAQIATAGESIKAGQFVYTDGPAPILEGADAKMAINEWALAIESYDFIIAHWTDSEAADAARNNKGVCLLALGRYDEAIAEMEPLVNNQKLRAYVLPNLARCWGKKGDEDRARNMIQLLVADTGETAASTRAREEVERFLMEAKN